MFELTDRKGEKKKGRSSLRIKMVKPVLQAVEE